MRTPSESAVTIQDSEVRVPFGSTLMFTVMLVSAAADVAGIVALYLAR